MIIVKIEAKPMPDNEEAEGLLGAYVVSYINFPDPEGAELLARHYVRKHGWEDGEYLDEGLYEVDLENVDEDDQEYVDEALEYGVSLIFHTYDKEDEDEDEDEENEDSPQND